MESPTRGGARGRAGVWSLALAGVCLAGAGCDRGAVKESSTVKTSKAKPAPSGSSSARPAVHHLLLEVKDLQTSIAFYRDRLGLELKSASKEFARLESANVGVYLWQKHWDWEAPRQKGERKGLGMYPHLYVPDVQALVARLKQARQKVVQAPRKYDWGTEAFIADPDGYIWALVTPAR